MFDDISPFNRTEGAVPPTLQRTKGAARCSFKRRGAASVLETLYQSGAFKVRLPHIAAGGLAEAVLINTAGGLTGGDRMSFDGGASAGAGAVFTTQASERAYRAESGTAVVATRLQAAGGAHIAWLPQETIIFDGASLSRTLDIDLAPDATLLAHESVVFGRTAMGEAVRRGAFSDTWRIRRAGALVHADALRIDGDIAAALARPAALNGARAMATLVYIGADCADVAARARPVVEGISADCGVAGLSAWPEKLVIRAASPSGQALRRITMPLIEALGGGHGLPRVWST